jgi:hypothetical protein
VAGTGFISKGYDRSQRCYQLVNNGNKTQKVEITLLGSKDSPVINPAFYIKNWNSDGAKILVNGKETKCRIGINHELDGTDVVIFIPVNETKTETITIMP